MFCFFLSSAFWIWHILVFSIHVCKRRIGENKCDFRDCTVVDFGLRNDEIPLLKTWVMKWTHFPLLSAVESKKHHK